jgi:RNA polymerase-interacting CarD/CdnL/TRCF family regulator
MRSYQVGDVLFYPKLGPVRLVEWQQREIGGRVQLFSMWRGLDEGAGGLSHSIPMDNIDRVLRPLADKTEVEEIFGTLAEKFRPSSVGKYAPRIRAQRDKINQGGFLDMAEIVRDLHHRRGLPRPLGLTDNERTNLEHAMKVLSQEIGVALGIGAAAAQKRIEKAIESGK